jgi:hypothetical protein
VRGSLIFAVVLAALTAPACAAARVELPRDTKGQLAGDRLVTLVSTGTGGATDLRATPIAGGPAVTVVSIPRYGSGQDQAQRIEFRVSAAGIVYARTGASYEGSKTVQEFPEFFQVVWVGFDGTSRVLQECTGTASGTGGGLDIDGRIASWRDGCRGGDIGPILVADTSAAEPPATIAGSRAFGDAQVTGDYVAFDTGFANEPPGVAVVNWRTGQTVTAMRTPGAVGPFDVMADGTLLMITGTNSFTLRAFAPGDTTGRALVGPAATMSRPQVAGGRVALVSGAPGCSRRLSLVPVNGGLTPVACLDAVSDDVAFDGRRLLFTEARCADETLSLLDVDEPFAMRPPPRCPVIIAGRTLAVTASGRARVRVKCPAGCSFALGIREPGGNPRYGSFAFSASRSTHVITLRVPSSVRRALKRARRLKATAVLLASPPTTAEATRSVLRFTLVAS